MLGGSDRIRVLIVGPGPGSTGGMNTMIATSMASNLADEYEFRRISLHRDGGKLSKLRVAAVGLAALSRDLACQRPDLVWVHATKGASFQRKSVAVLMARAAGVPVVLHLHSDRAVDYLERASKSMRRLARMALGSCSAVVVLDPSWIPRLRRIGAADYRHIPNAVAVPPLVDRSGAQPGRILQVGKLLAGKGVFTALDAFESVLAEVPHARLHFVGDGEDEEALRERVRDAGIAEFVSFHGWVPLGEGLKLMESSHVVILPSEAEGLPMSLLEAMARAIPVVATPVGGIRSLLSDGSYGLLVPVGDSGALAEGLTRLLSEPEYAARVGASGRQRVLDEYSSQHFADVMSGLMREVLATHDG